MRSYIFAFSYVLLIGCTPVVVGAPCLLPTDLAQTEKIAPLPEHDVELSEGLKLWRKEHGEHKKLADRKNDTVKFVQEHCR